MFTDPTMSGRLAEAHCRDLLREAEYERLAMQARTDQPALFAQVRLRMSTLLFSVGRLLQPREIRTLRAANAPQSLNERTAGVGQR